MEGAAMAWRRQGDEPSREASIRKGEEKQLQCEEIHLRLILPTNRKE
jgi:hypothetical protein